MVAGWPAVRRPGASSRSGPVSVGRKATAMVVDGFALTDRRALVVGAETRVGRAIAGALAEAGARLALASSPDPSGAGGEDLLSPNGSDHLTISGSPDD